MRDEYEDKTKQLSAKTASKKLSKEREATLPLRDKVLLKMLRTNPKHQFHYLSPIK